MRGRGNKDVKPASLKMIERNYDKILSRFRSLVFGVSFLEREDILHETMLAILSDPKINDQTTDEEFIELFAYRLNVVVFQTSHDRKSEAKANYIFTKSYADDISTEEEDNSDR